MRLCVEKCDAALATRDFGGSATLPCDHVLLVTRCPTHEVTEVIRAIRRSDPNLPVTVIASSCGSNERDMYVNAGADAICVNGPSSDQVIRKVSEGMLDQSGVQPEILRAGPILLDRTNRAVRVERRDISLTNTEFGILLRLMERRVLSHGEILKEVLGVTERVETSKVRYHIANLRRKLGAAGALMETVRPRSLRLNV